jgi:hypothetical protein
VNETYCTTRDYYLQRLRVCSTRIVVDDDVVDMSTVVPADIVHMARGGDCLFRALAHAITGAHESHGTLRRIFCDFIANTPCEPYRSWRTIHGDDYLRRMRVAGTHARTHFELAAAAQLCLCAILVHEPGAGWRPIILPSAFVTERVLYLLCTTDDNCNEPHYDLVTSVATMSCYVDVPIKLGIALSSTQKSSGQNHQPRQLTQEQRDRYLMPLIQGG